jgi:hypothetical protein
MGARPILKALNLATTRSPSRPFTWQEPAQVIVRNRHR